MVFYGNASRAGGVPARRAVELYVSVMNGVFNKAPAKLEEPP